MEKLIFILLYHNDKVVRISNPLEKYPEGSEFSHIIMDFIHDYFEQLKKETEVDEYELVRQGSNSDMYSSYEEFFSFKTNKNRIFKLRGCVHCNDAMNVYSEHDGDYVYPKYL